MLTYCGRASWIKLLRWLLLASTCIQAAQTSGPIPWDQVGAKAGAEYKGDGLAVMPTHDGARLHCSFQCMDGEVTREGLWLTSTVTNRWHDRFQVKAVAVGRGSTLSLVSTGEVTVGGQTVTFTRSGLVEEYSVSIDGVRQDFVVLERPLRDSSLNGSAADLIRSRQNQALRVELAVTGAQVEQTAHGTQLVLENSGRKIAYTRLKVTDATGEELPARMEITHQPEIQNPKSHPGLAIVVEDAGAVYPVRIDPTFSDANWASMSKLPGADASVSAMTVDGSGHLYIGGDFAVAGNVIANRIAKWDGSSWSAFGLGLSGTVNALALVGGNLYAGGSFVFATNSGGATVRVNRIARWDGSNWNPLVAGLNGPVNALAVSGSDLYVGGTSFTMATNSGGAVVSVIRVAKWDGSSWSALGGGANSIVNSLAVSGSDLYAAGFFTAVTNSGGVGVAASRIARWNGSSWSAVGLGLNNTVNALAVSGGNLYAGGSFTAATNSGGATVVASRIARWDGSSWSPVGLGVNDTVNALAVSGSDLYAGGLFLRTTNTGGATVAASQIAKWNGTSWSALGGGLNDAVRALAASGSNLYAGGIFWRANGSGATGIPVERMAQWNGSNWSTPGLGMNGGVVALAIWGGDLYAGGGFTMTPHGPANRIAKWNGSSWSAVGQGLNASVNALAVSGSNLYVAGDFTIATNSGGAAVTVNRVARWDGNSWSALGLGVNSDVFALAVQGTNVYVGGSFWMAGGNDIENIAQWNGISWSAVGEGMNDWVFALAVSGTNVFAGGAFTSPANHVARWDGSSWNDLNFGLSSWVFALAVSGSNLYVGGEFSRAGEQDLRVNSIAKWDGSNWSALGTGMDGSVHALAVSGDDLYAGGEFYTAGGNTVNAVAKWDGSSWSALGSGVSSAVLGGAVYALAASASDLYVGGDFSTAGDKASANIARANFSAPLRFSTSDSVYTNKQFRITLTGPEGASAVIFASTNLQSWIPLTTNTLTGGSLNFTDTLATNFLHRFYRATIP